PARRQEVHLVFPRIRAERPSVAENNRLTFAPIFEVDLRAVFGGDCVHVATFLVGSYSFIPKSRNDPLVTPYPMRRDPTDNGNSRSSGKRTSSGVILSVAGSGSSARLLLQGDHLLWNRPKRGVCRTLTWRGEIFGSLICFREFAVAKRCECSPDFLCEKLRLFPGREMATFVELVVMDELGIRPLCPGPRRGIDLVWENADGDWDRDVFGVEKGQLVFPIETCRRNCGARHAVERDVVQDVVSRDAFGL